MDPAKESTLASVFQFPQIRSQVAAIPLGVLVIVTPLLLGGAPAWSVPLSALLAAAAFAMAGLDPSSLRRDRVLRAWLALVAVMALQLVPLPPALLGLLDAVSAEASAHALDPWRIDRSGAWRALHHDPGTGLSDLVYLLGLGAAYLATRRVASREGLDRVLDAAAASMLLVAFLAAAHFLTGQDHVYGLYRPRVASPPILSPLLNPNHLAAFTGAGAIVWLGRALSTENTAHKLLRGVAAALCGAVCALTLSRGGVASAVGGVLVFLGMNARNEGTLREPRINRRLTVQSLGGIVAGLCVVGAGWWVASTSLAREYAQGDVSKFENVRRALGLLRGHALLGLGSGAMPVAAAASGRLNPEYTFLRVESLPVDLLVAFGVPATAFALYQLGRALKHWFPPGAAPPVSMAVWAALLSLVVHDLADFSLFLGANGYLAAVLAGLAAGWASRSWKRPLPRNSARREAPLALALVVLALGIVARNATLESDRDRVDAAIRTTPGFFRTDEARRVAERHPFDPYLRLSLGANAAAEGDAAALRFVSAAMRLAPTWAQPHLLLARVFAANGRRSQSLVELAEALRRSATLSRPAARLVLTLNPYPSVEQLDRVAPPGPAGLEFLENVAEGSRVAAFTEALDEVMLRRWPDNGLALVRRAQARLAANDPVGASGYCDRLLRVAPRHAEGPRCRAAVAEARDDLDGALTVLGDALARVDDRYPLLAMRARIYARRRDPASMRRETAAMLEAAGSDLTRLIEAHGLRGQLEESVGNLRGAYDAYERAHALAVPDQPFLLQIASLAARLRDRPALEQACAVLMERSPPDPSALRLCVRDPDAGVYRSVAAPSVDAAVTPGDDAGEGAMPALGAGR
ncbi:MAG: hypothetical protein JNK72_05215 [Myxococcales bacterium]|nr:hypothetical protein [Myxococcales bacterium]